jgi:hypothetical protein
MFYTGDCICSVVLRAKEVSIVVLEYNNDQSVFKFDVYEGDAWCMLQGTTYSSYERTA